MALPIHYFEGVFLKLKLSSIKGKDGYHMLSLIYRTFKKDINELNYKRKTDSKT